MNQLDEFATAESLLLITCDFGTGAEAAEMMPDALRSDHAAFLQKGYPEVLITEYSTSNVSELNPKRRYHTVQLNFWPAKGRIHWTRIVVQPLLLPY